MEKNKEVVEETTDKPIEKVEEIKAEKQPRDKKGRFKSADDDNVIKVNLDKPISEEKEEITKVSIPKEPEAKSVEEEPKQEEVVETELVIEEVTEANQVKEEAVKAIEQAEVTGKPLPENIQKLVDFMDETGGDINDYVKLNRDVKEMDDADVLDEYYKSTKSHLSPEERAFLLEDSYGIDEDVDDEKTN